MIHNPDITMELFRLINLMNWGKCMCECILIRFKVVHNITVINYKVTLINVFTLWAKIEQKRKIKLYCCKSLEDVTNLKRISPLNLEQITLEFCSGVQIIPMFVNWINEVKIGKCLPFN